MYKNTNTMPFCIFVLGIMLPMNKIKICKPLSHKTEDCIKTRILLCFLEKHRPPFKMSWQL